MAPVKQYEDAIRYNFTSFVIVFCTNEAYDMAESADPSMNAITRHLENAKRLDQGLKYPLFCLYRPARHTNESFSE